MPARRPLPRRSRCRASEVVQIDADPSVVRKRRRRQLGNHESSAGRFRELDYLTERRSRAASLHEDVALVRRHKEEVLATWA